MHIAHPQRFKKRGKKWYNWTPEEADVEWQAALRDKNVAKGRDEYGNVTVAKLASARLSNGRTVNSMRSLQEESTKTVSTSADLAALGRGRTFKNEELIVCST